MKLLTIIYKSGVVVEMSCEDYHTTSRVDRSGEERVTGLVPVAADPRPVTLIDMEDVAAVYEGTISGAHDRARDHDAAEESEPHDTQPGAMSPVSREVVELGGGF